MDILDVRTLAQGVYSPTLQVLAWSPGTKYRVNLPDVSDYLTQAEIEALIPDLTDYATLQAVADATADYLTQAEIEALIPSAQAVMPVGSVIAYYGTTAPDGWSICDNTAIPLASELGAHLSAQGKADNGDGTINLPDLRVAVVGGKSPAITLGASQGADSITLSVEQIPEHNHSTVLPDNTKQVDSAVTYAGTAATLCVGKHSGNTGNTGSGAAIDIRQRTVYLNHIIYGGTTA